MAHELYIHPCIHRPRHPLHPPPVDKPLRIQIDGPLEAIRKLLPHATWDTHLRHRLPFPLAGGVELARLTHSNLYGSGLFEGASGALKVRDEYLGWAVEGRRPLDYIDYYGVTFDYLVPPEDYNPEVLAINIIELEDETGLYTNGENPANEHLLFSVNASDYKGKKVLAVPRCCQLRKGSTDRERINGCVLERDDKHLTFEEARQMIKDSETHQNFT